MRQVKTPTDWSLNIKKFSGGSVTLLDEARVNPTQAVETTNLMQVQDGLWETRWGTEYYGNALPDQNDILGISEYQKENGDREIIAVGGTNGRIYKSSNANAWTQIGSTTFNTSAPLSFVQLNSFLYIANGVDNLSRYDGNNIIAYTALSAPVANTITRGSALSAGSFNYFYVITALNEVGETISSNELTIDVNIDRNIWGGVANRTITIAWSAVSGAKSYQVYIGTETGKHELLTSTVGLTYVDDGSLLQNPYVFPPEGNTTTAPKFSEMSIINNRIWGTKDPDNKYRVYWSGTGLFPGAFASSYGGGWVDLEKGGKEFPVYVGNYRTGKGDTSTTVLCNNPEGVGSVWQISLETIVINDETSFQAPFAIKIIGSIGSTSPKAVVVANDNLMFANKRAIYSLGTKQQVFNVLSTDEVSANIRPSYQTITQSKLDEMVGYWYDAKIFYSVAINNSSKNNIIFIFDTERRNWTWSWDIGVKQFLEFTETGGVSHFLALKPNCNRIIRFNKNLSTDLGQAFPTSYLSGLISIDTNEKAFAMLREAMVSLGRPRGKIRFEIIGIRKKKGLTTIASKLIENLADVSNVNFVDETFSDIVFSENSNLAVSFRQSTIKKVIRIRKLINAIQFKVSSSEIGTQYTLLAIQAFGRLMPTSTPSEWKI